MEDKKTLQSIRAGYGQGLLHIGGENKNLVVLTADLTESTCSHLFAGRYPERFVQCGISEQNMMGMAAGLALGGKIPFVNSFAVFNPGRNWDQLRVSVCYSNLNVKIAGHHTGFSNGPDGASHQALEDIAITRVLPNITILNPADPLEAELAVKEALKIHGPVYIRLSKYDLPVINEKITRFPKKAEVLREGKDLTLAVSGALTSNCLFVANLLSKDIDIEVVKFSNLKPFDTETLISSVKKTNKVLTVEDHQISAGFGGIVAEVLSEHHPVYIYRHGVYDSFGQSGSVADLLKYYQLDVPGIVAVIKKVFLPKKI